jgi:predicted adenylyl cyclase CyaB
MPIEVERKAWVRDPRGLREELTRRHGQPRETTKSDRYYIEPEAAARALERSPRKFRLRQETGRPAVATAKARSLQDDGTEVNQETEFEVSDPRAFERFALEHLGWSIQVDKTKRTWAFSAQKLTIEVSEVEGLGWFFEVERLIEKKANLREAEKMIDQAFEEFGRFLSAVESRPYTALLLGKAQPPE